MSTCGISGTGDIAAQCLLSLPKSVTFRLRFGPGVNQGGGCGDACRQLKRDAGLVPTGRGGAASIRLIANTCRDSVACMPADAPTILATSGGGIRPGRRVRWEFTALTDYAVELSGVTGRAPRICLIATGCGDDASVVHHLYGAAHEHGFRPSHLDVVDSAHP